MEEAPTWIALCGLPATGKSVLARALAEASGASWPVFATDALRKELAGAPADGRLPESCYKRAFSRRTYDTLYQRAGAAARTAPVVLLDGNFRGRDERSRARATARECGAGFVLVETTARHEVIRSRLQQRAARPDATSGADLAVYGKLRASFEVPDDDEADHVPRIESTREPESLTEDLLARLI